MSTFRIHEKEIKFIPSGQWSFIFVLEAWMGMPGPSFSAKRSSRLRETSQTEEISFMLFSRFPLSCQFFRLFNYFTCEHLGRKESWSSPLALIVLSPSNSWSNLWSPSLQGTCPCPSPGDLRTRQQKEKCFWAMSVLFKLQSKNMLEDGSQHALHCLSSDNTLVAPTMH